MSTNECLMNGRSDYFAHNLVWYIKKKNNFNGKEFPQEVLRDVKLLYVPRQCLPPGLLLMARKPRVLFHLISQNKPWAGSKHEKVQGTSFENQCLRYIMRTLEEKKTEIEKEQNGRKTRVFSKSKPLPPQLQICVGCSDLCSWLFSLSFCL